MEDRPGQGGRSTTCNSLTDGCLVNGKESELFEVIVNLIKNAAEALPSGGEISIKTFVQADDVMLQVTDTGVGISGENLKRVFEPFWTTKGVSAGTGMGLAVSHGSLCVMGEPFPSRAKKEKAQPLRYACPCQATKRRLNLRARKSYG